MYICPGVPSDQSYKCNVCLQFKLKKSPCENSHNVKSHFTYFNFILIFKQILNCSKVAVYFTKRDFTIGFNPLYKDFTIAGWMSLQFIIIGGVPWSKKRGNHLSCIEGKWVWKTSAEFHNSTRQYDLKGQSRSHKMAF